MPFNRPTLSELRQRNLSYIQSELKTGGNLLRFSNIGVISDADAGMAHLHYGYLDYIAQQSTPYHATDEYLAAWAALKDVFRKPANPATCPIVEFSGTAGRVILAGSLLNRADGYQYRLDHGVTLGADGTGTGSITAVLPSVLDDTTGGGIAGNADAGTSLTLDVAIDGVMSVATAIVKISGGADIESEDAFRSRMLLAYQNTPQGGNDTDYRGWALAVPGVTRCWVKRRLQGVGTVGVYIMCDGNDSGGFPVGTDGVSQLEEWGAVKATGDQARVADFVYPLQPIIAIIYVCAPIAAPVNFVISGISTASSETTTAINAAIDEVFFTEGEPGGKILLSSLLLAIGDVTGTSGFILDSPTTNIQLDTGQLPIRGTVTYL
ncbi:TPA: baseplate J/gp47 family protein [Yersinia enterocolitica]|uniref:baseplate J/gp47 family protein n=1 Tax=Yersinia enterocolitica TaxID=630 RepID=UPI0005FCEC3F|nr:baseplate J/gp47 family protein [Yersinia enterocolitica]EKN5930791.1 baseplate J/gp47 family protein [Yersinia enterocolitica]ELY5257844.1 baseplate J/gp47 family protein [Yersinia enterocolitica]CRE62079.1 baseplate J family protein [Yersinia enterocolitica]HDL6628064.1 baseplate J/gp47 family protein [Yersinia enterocolitica]HDL6654011.1 baseplate J/gp47 family protein [Yersinia enterocolitica]